MELLNKYFPGLSTVQVEQYEALFDLYSMWNERINVISRKDIDQLYLRHVLHSLAISRVCWFEQGARILDIGCGGGFPSIPLAIMFPLARFTMVDSIGKKIKVAQAVAQGVGLTNVTALHCRAEEVDGKFDYVVSRAVTDMKSIIDWTWPKIERGKHGTLENGILCLKGGDLAQELAESQKRCNIYDIASFFDEEFFQTKKVIYIKR